MGVGDGLLNSLDESFAGLVPVVGAVLGGLGEGGDTWLPGLGVDLHQAADGGDDVLEPLVVAIDVPQQALLRGV